MVPWHFSDLGPCLLKEISKFSILLTNNLQKNSKYVYKRLQIPIVDNFVQIECFIFQKLKVAVNAFP